MEVQPGNRDVVAVARRSIFTFPRHAGVAIFRQGSMRP